MNKTIDFTQPGGLFTYQDTFDFLQTAYAGALDAIAAMYGDKVIVQGLVPGAGSSISDGWVVYNGELIPVTGGTVNTYLHLNTTIGAEQFADGTSKNVYTTKNFVFTATSGGNVAFNTFKRLPYNGSTLYDSLNSFKTLLQKIVNVEDAVILSGCNVSSVTGTSSGTATISAGVVMIDGEIVTAPLRTAGAWPCWLKPDGTYATSDPGGTNIKFDYETSQRYADVMRRFQYASKHVYISNDHNDVDLFDASTGLGKWKWLGWKLCFDLRSRVPLGYDNRTSAPGGADNEAWDSDYNTPGNSGGERRHLLTVAELPSHDHGLPDHWNESGGAGHIASGGGTNEGPVTDRTDDTGGDDPHENRPPYRVMLFIERL